MPRTARRKAESKIYHIVLRGINKQTIFFDDEDREVFLNRMKLAKEKKEYKVYAFCLMGNHIHLLLREGEVSIGNIFRMILSSYVYWYNRKYKRVGNLFQDRYRSEIVKDDAHLLGAARYIHQNPVKAGIVKGVGEYKWSSHSAYVNKEINSFVDTGFVLSTIGGLEEYVKFVEQDDQTVFEENESKTVITDEDLEREIKRIMRLKSIFDFQKCDRKQIEDIISTVRQTVRGVSIRQISRVTGVSVNIVRHIR